MTGGFSRGGIMSAWWAEQWSFGRGRARTYCGIRRTPEGFAVEVFRGDTCVDSFVYGSVVDAKRVAHGLKLQYRNRILPSSDDLPGRTPA